MEMKYIDALIYDGNKIECKEIDNSVDGFRKEIGCDTFEGYCGTELGHLYGLDVYLDGNGKIREDKPKVVGLFVRKETNQIVDTLVGRLLICRHDEEGDSIDVNADDIDKVMAHVINRDATNIIGKWKDSFGTFDVSDYLLVLYC